MTVTSEMTRTLGLVLLDTPAGKFVAFKPGAMTVDQLPAGTSCISDGIVYTRVSRAKRAGEMLYDVDCDPEKISSAEVLAAQTRLHADALASFTREVKR